MLKNYFNTARRNMIRNKSFSVINIVGLSIAIMVVIIISLWLWDELSYNRYHDHYGRIAQVMRHSDFNGGTSTQASMAVPLRDELENNFGADFKYISLSTASDEHVLRLGNKMLSAAGRFMEEAAPEMLSLRILHGTRSGLRDPGSIMLSESLAKTLFGHTDAVGHILNLNNGTDVKVTGVYQDVPANSRFADLAFLAPWELHVSMSEWAQKAQDSWAIHSFEIYVQVSPGVSMNNVSARIQRIERDHLGPDIARIRNPRIFLHPMSRWHLYSEWKDGVNTGGRIQFVWLFGTIGFFVLLLACINFMNLCTAYAAKRAREVGIRKAMGSARGQLIGQFFSESVLMTICAFSGAVALTALTLPFFNALAGKKVEMLWTSPFFWLLGVGFCLFTGLLAGLYPALYLSSFRPVKVLKSALHAGNAVLAPRKMLVAVQFTISVMLIIGTLIVYRQVQFAKDRPAGYDRDGLITLRMDNPEIQQHYEAIRNDLLNSGTVVEVAASQGPTTEIWDERSGFDWPGKDPDFQADFATIAVTHDYGKTVGWEFIEGRDFSREFSTDLSSGVVINEAAMKFMGLEDPVERHTAISWAGQRLNIIGVIKDMIMTSPYEPVKQTVFYVNYGNVNHVLVRIKPGTGVQDALTKIETIFRKYSPGVPFSYRFVDEEYAAKFASEELIGRLAACFATLAIFVSCLGLLGLTIFVTGQRTREIGIRKVLGATVTSITIMLSRDFVKPVLVAVLIASPIAWYVMEQWLYRFTYRIGIPWHTFALAALLVVTIALLTVGLHATKAALMNPVRSLRSE